MNPHYDPLEPCAGLARVKAWANLGESPSPKITRKRIHAVRVGGLSEPYIMGQCQQQALDWLMTIQVEFADNGHLTPRELFHALELDKFKYIPLDRLQREAT